MCIIYEQMYIIQRHRRLDINLCMHFVDTFDSSKLEDKLSYISSRKTEVI